MSKDSLSQAINEGVESFESGKKFCEHIRMAAFLISFTIELYLLFSSNSKMALKYQSIYIMRVVYGQSAIK